GEQEHREPRRGPRQLGEARDRLGHETKGDRVRAEAERPSGEPARQRALSPRARQGERESGQADPQPEIKIRRRRGEREEEPARERDRDGRRRTKGGANDAENSA